VRRNDNVGSYAALDDGTVRLADWPAAAAAGPRLAAGWPR